MISNPYPDYSLVWPLQLFEDEYSAIIAYCAGLPDGFVDERDEQIMTYQLVQEAFRGKAPSQYLADIVGRPNRIGPYKGADPLVFSGLMTEILSAARECEKQENKREPHFTERLGLAPAASVQTWPPKSFPYRWRRLIDEFGDAHYFQRNPRDIFGASPGFADTWQATDPSPFDLEPRQAPELEHVYDLVEVAHRHVSRPRLRDGLTDLHRSSEAGQRLYRWRVNELLNNCGIDYRIADRGSDTGLLVRVVPDLRQELLDRSVAPEGGQHEPAVVDVNQGARVRHAIAQFRRRDATRETKRDACVNLAGILEERRELIKKSGDFAKDDENALFEIANKFDLRHNRRTQHGDYSDDFLDWIFWLYLASVELTERLLARGTGS